MSKDEKKLFTEAQEKVLNESDSWLRDLGVLEKDLDKSALALMEFTGADGVECELKEGSSIYYLKISDEPIIDPKNINSIPLLILCFGCGALSTYLFYLLHH